ncbi:MAG: monofunctional biosynthetic peptidoglycan transglycosylase [Gammaproteobacteria bacterium]|nr:monofunctional biosynthetic peptidoglycan transglycosylase [Gammaproteobacteria bacterium]
MLLRAALLAIGASVVLVLLLRWVPPPTSAFMLAARVSAMTGGDFAYSNAYDWEPLERISPHAAMAAIAAEDQQFPFHAGFDFESIRKAVQHNAKSERKRGASTISQQIAKNLFLWSGRSWVRKGLEVWFTVLIEAAWPKERILEVYLNVAEFGRGTWGVQAAARKFFGKDAVRLTRREAATLAAVLPNPQRLRVDRPSSYVQRRRDTIMGQMRALGGPGFLRQLDDEEPSAPRK